MTYYLGLDLGTGSLKTVLFDVNGLEIAASAVEYPLYQPHNGWSEQNPEDWYQAALKTVKAGYGSVRYCTGTGNGAWNFRADDGSS